MAILEEAFDIRLVLDGWPEWDVEVRHRIDQVIEYTIHDVGRVELVPLSAGLTRIVFIPATNYGALPYEDKLRIYLQVNLTVGAVTRDTQQSQESEQPLRGMSEGVVLGDGTGADEGQRATHDQRRLDMPEPAPLPPDPPNPDMVGWKAFFDWYYAVLKHRPIRVTELIAKTHYSESAVRHKKMEYDKEHGKGKHARNKNA
ncbi:MAG: hypothetical protein M3R24_25435 [Chloroflexota bacterium]|nr:hypothetical protein [Chloroflexota bacterium]